MVFEWTPRGELVKANKFFFDNMRRAQSVILSYREAGVEISAGQEFELVDEVTLAVEFCVANEPGRLVANKFFTLSKFPDDTSAFAVVINKYLRLIVDNRLFAAFPQDVLCHLEGGRYLFMARGFAQEVIKEAHKLGL